MNGLIKGERERYKVTKEEIQMSNKHVKRSLKFPSWGRASYYNDSPANLAKIKYMLTVTLC